MAATKTDVTDASYAVRAVEDLAALFGKAPRAYAYDRGGYSTENVRRLRKLGVRDSGLAPRGRTPCEVEGKVKDPSSEIARWSKGRLALSSAPNTDSTGWRHAQPQ